MTRRLLAFAVFALLLPAPRLGAAEPKVIKLATLVPQGSVWEKEIRATAAEVQKRTAGRVSFRIYPGGVAGDDPDVVRKMRLGQLQAASLTITGLSDLDRGFAVFSVPRFFASYDELFPVAHALTPMLSERLDKAGFVFLGWADGGWFYWFSKQPVYTPDDFKKLKLWVAAGDNRMVQWWKANGFHPVPLATTDILTGLTTGMIDALPTTPLIALTLQWYRSAPHMLDLGMAPLVGGTVITKRAWSEISPADQAIVREVMLQMQQRLETAIPAQDKQALDEMAHRGLDLTHPKDPQQVKAWDDAAAQFAATMREQVVPSEIFDLARKSRDGLRATKH